ncbi:MAG: amidohydrolase family protein [bacterium]|nr:amidohydrolase family protein [bacterium]
MVSSSVVYFDCSGEDVVVRLVQAGQPDIPSFNTFGDTTSIIAEFDLDAATLIDMATTRPAQALGLEYTIGTITPGHQADLTAIPLDPTGPTDGVANVLHSHALPARTFANGRWIEATTDWWY